MPPTAATIMTVLEGRLVSDDGEGVAVGVAVGEGVVVTVGAV